jgi:hypothetical protein
MTEGKSEIDAAFGLFGDDDSDDDTGSGPTNEVQASKSDMEAAFGIFGDDSSDDDNAPTEQVAKMILKS